MCSRHFDPRFIVREYTFCKSDGAEYTTPRSVPVLSEDELFQNWVADDSISSYGLFKSYGLDPWS